MKHTLIDLKESKVKIILASKSPRRQELLKNLKVVFDVVTSEFDEKKISSKGRPPHDYACELAHGKAMAVYEKLGPLPGVERLIIGADTVVDLNGNIMGQPEDEADAFRMLKSLSGVSNEVVTGVSVIKVGVDGKVTFHNGYESTNVFFKKLTDAEIKKYIATGEPMDKAGAYGIQGAASLFVEKIEGCYFNVVGLPIMRLSKLMALHGYCFL